MPAAVTEKIKELSRNVVRLKGEGDPVPYTSLCSIMDVDSISVDNMLVTIKSKKISLDHYLNSMPERRTRNIISGLMSIDENYKYLPMAGTKKFIDNLFATTEHIDWIKKKINEHNDKNERHISVLLDNMKFISSISSEMTREYTVEEFLLIKNPDERKEIVNAITKLESRIKDTENSYDPEFSIGQGWEARGAAVALDIMVGDLEVFVRNDMKARDWAIRKVIETVQGKLGELEKKSLAKGLALEKVMEAALPSEKKQWEEVKHEIRESNFTAAIRVIQAAEELLEKVEMLSQYATSAKEV